LASGDEWQVIGFTGTRETIEVRLDKLAREIKEAGGKVPQVDVGSAGGDDSDDEPREKSQRRRKSTSSGGGERRRSRA
jgi:hypothetical protein